VIDYLNKDSEFDIQATLYNELKLVNGLEVFGEFKVLGGKIGSSVRKQLCRFDLIVFKNKKPLVIIEVKRGNRNKGIRKQLDSYRKFGIPVLVCKKMKGIKYILKQVNLMNGG